MCPTQIDFREHQIAEKEVCLRIGVLAVQMGSFKLICTANVLEVKSQILSQNMKFSLKCIERIRSTIPKNNKTNRITEFFISIIICTPIVFI